MNLKALYRVFVVAIVLKTFIQVNGEETCPAFCSCGNETVDCSNQGLWNIPRGIPASTKTLYLNNNSLGELTYDALKDLASLERLFLRNNSVAKISVDAFKSNQNIYTLHLEDNLLETLPHGVFNASTQIYDLTLRGNPIRCDCRSQWLRKWIEEQPIRLQKAMDDELLCDAPTKHKGKPLRKVELNDLTCEIDVIILSPNITVVNGSTVNLTCEVHGHPGPIAVTWLKIGNVSADKGKRISVFTHEWSSVLQILNTTTQDYGLYECEAINGVGQTKTAILHLNTFQETPQNGDNQMPIKAHPLLVTSPRLFLASSHRRHNVTIIDNTTLLPHNEESCKCENNGSCTRTANHSSCVCTAGWRGKHCEIRANEIRNTLAFARYTKASHGMGGKSSVMSPATKQTPKRESVPHDAMKFLKSSSPPAQVASRGPVIALCFLHFLIAFLGL